MKLIPDKRLAVQEQKNVFFLLLKAQQVLFETSAVTSRRRWSSTSAFWHLWTWPIYEQKVSTVPTFEILIQGTHSFWVTCLSTFCRRTLATGDSNKAGRYACCLPHVAVSVWPSADARPTWSVEEGVGPVAPQTTWGRGSVKTTCFTWMVDQESSRL